MTQCNVTQARLPITTQLLGQIEKVLSKSYFDLYLEALLLSTCLFEKCEPTSDLAHQDNHSVCIMERYSIPSTQS